MSEPVSHSVSQSVKKITNSAKLDVLYLVSICDVCSGRCERRERRKRREWVRTGEIPDLRQVLTAAGT